MSDETASVPTTETVKEANSTVSKYNKLVEEANELGMKGYRPIATRFRDTATGEARVAALESSIKAFKEGIKGAERQPGPEVQPQEEASMAKSTSVRKTKTAAKKAKEVVRAKRKANDNARRKVAAEKPVRNGIAGVFGSREGSNQETLLLKLEKGKPVGVGEIMKSIYGKDSDEYRGALGAVLAGVRAKAKKLKYELVQEGRGDEATFALVKK
jgi:hypothetical protein